MRRYAQEALHLLAALACLAPGLALTAENETWVVPTETCRGFWFVPIMLNEEKFGPGKVLNFIYDTGASSTIVDAAALERASGRSFDDGDRVRLVDATAGDVTFTKLPARVDSLGHLSMALGRSVDGILGVDAFKQFLLTLDPGTQTMTLSKGSLPRPDGETVFSSRGPGNRPWLKVSIAGNKERLLVDSGAAGTGITVNKIKRFPLQAEPRVFSSSVRLNHVEKRRMARLSGSVPVAGVTFIDPVLEEVPGTQLMGGQVLQHFVMRLDQRTRRLQLEPIGASEQPPQPHFELGMAYRPTDTGLAVTDVYADTPAEAAGLEAGDVLIRINGSRPDQRGCESLTRDGQEVALSVERDGAVIQKTMVMRPVIGVD